MSSTSAKRFPLALSDVIASGKPRGGAKSNGSQKNLQARGAKTLSAKASAPAVPAARDQPQKGPSSPEGLGLTSERVRSKLVARLAEGGIGNARVLAAIEVVPRHLFVDVALANQAYEDAALPIGHGQTISKPSVVARMIELLCASGRPLHKVLEIGTGCGYQAAVLGQVAKEVYSIERIRPLHERAKANLRPLRAPNIRLHYGDGMLGLPLSAPFDGVILAAAGLEIPSALLDQLDVGARLVAPLGGEQQTLTMIERTGPRQWRETRLDRVYFVPLKSGIV